MDDHGSVALQDLNWGPRAHYGTAPWVWKHETL